MAMEYEHEGRLRGILVHELKTKKNPADPETRKLMNAWVGLLEQRSQATRESKGHVHHQLELARLYAEAEFPAEALETFGSAWEQARRDFPVLAQEIWQEMDAYRASLEG